LAVYNDTPRDALEAKHAGSLNPAAMTRFLVFFTSTSFPLEHLLDKTTQVWVKLTGRRIDPEEHAWLLGPIGSPDVIGDTFVNRLAEAENLTVQSNEPHFGLLESVGQIGVTAESKPQLRPEIIDFYEHTASYDFEFWSSWRGIFQPFGQLLSFLFSKRLKQLNLPLNPLDSAKGLTSNILKLKDGDETRWTVWYRILKSNNRVIYSGVYTTCRPQGQEKRHLKVVFPLPNGSATVVMRVEVEADGSLLLSSDGKRYGGSGFYFLLTDHRGTYWARFVPAMHEWIRVYVDTDGSLRADHSLNFHGIRFFDLHYKMRKR